MLHMHGRGLNSILADEMGLGKTLQSISLMACISFIHDKNVKKPLPHLVVVPLTVLGNWR